jgi:hypothetical protein
MVRTTPVKTRSIHMESNPKPVADSVLLWDHPQQCNISHSSTPTQIFLHKTYVFPNIHCVTPEESRSTHEEMPSHVISSSQQPKQTHHSTKIDSICICLSHRPVFSLNSGSPNYQWSHYAHDNTVHAISFLGPLCLMGS